MKFFHYLAINTMIPAAVITAVFCGAQTETITQVERPLPAGSPALVMQNCEKAPEGVLPTGVMVQEIGGGTSIKRNQAAVTRGLLVVLDGKGWKGVRVLDFCK